MKKVNCSDNRTRDTRFQKPLLVEFIGPPGGGKSTICRALDELTISCPDVCLMSAHASFIQKLLRRTRFDYLSSIGILKTRFRRSPYVQNGILNLYLAGIRQSEHDPKVERMRRHALVRNLVQHLQLRNRGIGAAFVIDEGLAQRGISAWLSGVPPRILVDHYAYMPLADLYVYVDIGEKSATARLEKRDGKDWRCVSTGDYAQVVEHIAERGRPILRVSGERSPHESAATVYREMLRQFL